MSGGHRCEYRADAERWREAEATGHVVDIAEDGFGLQHPPSCRPGLLDCGFYVWLHGLDSSPMPPGRYQMTWPEGDPVYAAVVP